MDETFLTKIENYSFSEEGIDELKKISKYVIDWPVVYILNSDKEAYIGGTQSAVDRINQYLAHKSSTRKNLAWLNLQTHII